MRHFPALRSPARLTGLQDSLTRSPEPSPHLGTLLAVGLALFLAGLALGIVADACAALPVSLDLALVTTPRTGT